MRFKYQEDCGWDYFDDRGIYIGTQSLNLTIFGVTFSITWSSRKHKDGDPILYE